MKKFLSAGIILVGIIWTGKIMIDYTKRSSVPKSIVNQYYDLRNSQKDWPSGSLARCTKDEKTFYIVNTNSTYVGEDYYYDEKGTYLGNMPYTDAIVPGTKIPQPPIVTKGYQCMRIFSWGWANAFERVYTLN